MFTAGVFTTLGLIAVTNLASKRNPKRRKKIVCFGDSITQQAFNVKEQGWVAHLADIYSRKVDVLNRGYSGYNSKHGVEIVQEMVLNENPDLVTVFFGANDASIPESQQHVPLGQYEQNLRTIILAIMCKYASTPIILITPPPIWRAKLTDFLRSVGSPFLEDRTNER